MSPYTDLKPSLYPRTSTPLKRTSNEETIRELDHIMESSTHSFKDARLNVDESLRSHDNDKTVIIPNKVFSLSDTKKAKRNGFSPLHQINEIQRIGRDLFDVYESEGTMPAAIRLKTYAYFTTVLMALSLLSIAFHLLKVRIFFFESWYAHLLFVTTLLGRFHSLLILSLVVTNYVVLFYTEKCLAFIRVVRNILYYSFVTTRISLLVYKHVFSPTINVIVYLMPAPVLFFSLCYTVFDLVYRR